jgi:hypothetical protein
MNLNIGLALAIAVIAMVTTGLAGQLAATKGWHKWVFWGGGFIMLILIGIQTYNNETDQQQLRAQLNLIQKNTEKPSNVQVNVPPPQVVVQGGKNPQHTHVDFLTPTDLPVSSIPIVPFHEGQEIPLNLGLYDSGDFPAANTSVDARVLIETTNAAKDGKAMMSEFLKTAKFLSCGTLNPHLNRKGCYKTHLSAKLSQDQARQLNSGDLAVCLVGRGNWRDESGQYHTNFGECLIEETPTIFNWHITNIDREEGRGQ